MKSLLTVFVCMMFFVFTYAKKAKEEAAAVKNPVSLTLSVVGDCTLGTDETFDYDTSLNACYDNNGKDYFFMNVKSIFEADDLTIANFEGTLTDSDAREDKTFAFKAPAEYAQILTSGSVEAVNTANNQLISHSDNSKTNIESDLEVKTKEVPKPPAIKYWLYMFAFMIITVLALKYFDKIKSLFAFLFKK